MSEPYTVTFVDQAYKQLDKLDRPVRVRIMRKIRELATDPRPAGSIPLKGDTDSWRLRVSDYRIVYAIRDGELVVLMLSVAHRREVYRDL
ncbi:type II toxin-antitoxin system RelE/ParE family toxin [Nocardiopsis sp. MG754419]|uniref:type II toxin-antitoxin system RelE family toxin n=1 Tax=Nocardiopsis sp. MG754419 TaxID=2259865 RepID=UPI001BABA62C|nr:type II toxin-antitoxin system RelE/ParE family toxin [Nocardiopsis sp. MG754419]MBR8742927.1 type II toxin-antitoxin system RelE/ParE family toxin [Nocardiopsis sp. MG754419]